MTAVLEAAGVLEQLQSAHRRSRVAGVPAAAIVWGRLRPAHRRSRVADLFAAAIVLH